MEEQVCKITGLDVSPLSEEALFQHWLARMPERRRKKALSFRFPEGRRLSLGAGILLKRALEEEGVDASSAVIRENEFGQPYLRDEPDLHFSLSHSGSVALCALSGRPVGCDAEQVGRGDGRIADRFFHPEEQALLSTVRDPAQWQRLFARIWTRKESYLKALGKGLNEPMDSFSAVNPPPGVRYAEPEPPEGLFRSAEYAFSCCVLGEGETEFLWRTETL